MAEGGVQRARCVRLTDNRKLALIHQAGTDTQDGDQTCFPEGGNSGPGTAERSNVTVQSRRNAQQLQLKLNMANTEPTD